MSLWYIRGACCSPSFPAARASDVVLGSAEEVVEAAAARPLTSGPFAEFFSQFSLPFGGGSKKKKLKPERAATFVTEDLVALNGINNVLLSLGVVRRLVD